MKLKNCCNFIDYRGKTPEKAKSGYRFITAKNIGINGFHDEPMEFIPKENYERVMVRGIPSEGDILFTTEAPMGHVGVIPHFDEPFAVGQRIIVIQPNNELLNSSYLVHLLRSRNFQDKVSGRSSGSTVTGIRSKELVEIDIKFPNIVEQHKIAEVLDQLSAVISKRTAELQLYDELIKARFVELFGNPLNNEKGWGMISIEDISEMVTYGLTVRPEYVDKGIPVISAAEIKTGKVNYDVAKLISEDDYKTVSEKGKPQKGELLFGKAGASIGYCAYIEEDIRVAITQNIARIVLKKNVVNPLWVMYYLKSEDIQLWCQKEAKGNAIKDLQIQTIKSMPIFECDISLQNEFASFVKQVDKSKVEVQKVLERTQFLFDSLMQKHFGG